MKIKPLPRKTIYLDKRGRIVIPQYMRKALNLETPSWITLETYPNLKNPSTILIKKR